MSDHGGWDDGGDWDDPSLGDDPAADGGAGPVDDDLADDGYDDDPFDDTRAAAVYEDEDPRDAEPEGRSRGPLLALLAVLVALLVAGAAIVVLEQAGDDDDEASSGRDTTSTTRSRASTSSTGLALPGSPTDSTVAPGSSTTSTAAGPRTSTTRRPGAPAPTTTAAPDGLPEPGCASGTSGGVVPVEANWATKWQTMPKPNDPAKVTICVDDLTPKVGQVVKLSLRAHDDDAVIVPEECGYFVTWEGSHANLCRDALVASPGPRPTPPEEFGDRVVQLTHVYGSAGPKTIIGSVRSSRWEGYRTPYASDAQASLDITVHA